MIGYMYTVILFMACSFQSTWEADIRCWIVGGISLWSIW